MALSDYIYIGDVNKETRTRLLRIVERFIRLSPDAQEVIAEDIDKFCNGHDEHGPMFLERGDWPQHLLEELIDARFYIRMEILKRRREATQIASSTQSAEVHEPFDLEMHPL